MRVILLLIATFLSQSPKTDAADTSRCFLYGNIKSTMFSGNGIKDTSLSDMIRLKLDADSAKKCEAMVSSYCRYNILDKQAVPKSLKAYFKDTRAPASEVNFSIDAKCKITKSTDTSDDEVD